MAPLRIELVRWFFGDQSRTTLQKHLAPTALHIQLKALSTALWVGAGHSGSALVWVFVADDCRRQK